VQGEGQWIGKSEPHPGQLSEIYFYDVLSFSNTTAYGFPALLDQPGYGMLLSATMVFFGADFPLQVAKESFLCHEIPTSLELRSK
jgi:hypothetical protein